MELTQRDELWEVLVKDDGVGSLTTVDKTTDHHSMSQNITQTRLQLFEKRFEYQSDFSIEDRSLYGERGTQVHFVTPTRSL